jgi:5-formyltetrahydrofolate cyclo-ligase
VIVAGDATTRRKAALRTSLLATRRARPAPVIEAARTAIADAALAYVGTGACVAAYEPRRTEPGSLELLERLRAAGGRVLVPVLLESLDLSWTVWGEAGPALGVEAIAEVALAFVPALAVDAQGRRLGRGGGSYDRVLPRIPAGVPVVALVFDDELLLEVPVDPWDRPVNAALAPSGWHWFAG